MYSTAPADKVFDDEDDDIYNPHYKAEVFCVLSHRCH